MKEMMALEALLGEMPKQEFTARFLHRLPFSLPDAAGEICNLGTWAVLGELLETDAADVMVVRQGGRSEAPVPANIREARSLCDEGHTMLVRHAERRHAALQQLAESFERDFHAPVNIHMYVTPPGTHGFSWHYDAEDVFIIQTAGAKEYSLRKNTVNPWPLEETIPDDMRYERELMPMMQVELRAGDWLYIPCGYWHKAEALESEDAAISLAVGVTSTSAVNVVDFLRTRLPESILWRQRLPITGEAAALSSEELHEAYRDVFNQLADDLSAQLKSEQFLTSYLSEQSRFADLNRNSG